MKHLFSFGYLNVVTDNLAEIVIDRGAVLDAEHYHEFLEVINTCMSKPQAILLNRIHNFNCTPECIKLFAENDNIIAVASVRFFDMEKPEILQLVTNSYSKKLNYHFFYGLKLGRSKAISWLEQELSKVSSNA